MTFPNIITPHKIYYRTDNYIDRLVLRNFLNDVAHLYPGFDAWFNFKFYRGLSTGVREIIYAHDGNELVGVSLLKNSTMEKKLSTLFIKEEYRSQGIGKYLLTNSMEKLNGNCEITVSDERLSELTPLLTSAGFSRLTSREDYYRNGSVEHFFEY